MDENRTSRAFAGYIAIQFSVQPPIVKTDTEAQTVEISPGCASIDTMPEARYPPVHH
jgi:hypothetical protein